jgi:putative SbcD/Mre11-related phosphoesterase
MSRNTDSKTEIIKGIEIIDLALYLKEEKALVLADLHIGYEDALVKQGVLVPKFHFRELVERLERIFEIIEKRKLKVETIIINGDLKHEFGRISDEEWRNTLKVLDYLARRCSRIALVRGNHDTILGPIADKRNVLLVDAFFAGDKMIMHGDRIQEIPAPVKTIIIGHDHPAVGISEGIRREVYKCFLAGKYKGKNLIVQPSLSPSTEGTDVIKEDLLSPYLAGDIGKFKAYVVADEVYAFGSIKKLK